MLLATSNSIVSRRIIGQKAKEEHGNFVELSKRFLSLLSDFSFGDLFPFMGWLDVLTGLVGRLKATFNEMDAFLDSVIDEQKTLEHDMDDNNQKNFVQILIHLIQKDSMVDTRLTQDNLKAILLDMFVAGVESTAIRVEWVMAELLKNPGIMTKGPRREVFLPGRFENNPIDFRGQNFEFIPFGVGRRGCPGISFGFTILEFIIANLLYWFDWKLPRNADCGSMDMTEDFGTAAHKKFPLHLVPIAYCS
ncbi:hypothetical protein CRYUN_Cryun19dG0021700 [Craigia yunnanensis]